jgi:oligosaccharide reducing-end xylanase
MKRALSRSSLLTPLAALLVLFLGGCGGSDDGPPQGGAPEGGTSDGGGTEGDLVGSLDGDVNVDLFASLLQKSDAEVDEKVTTAVDRFFGIGTGEPNQLIVEGGYRCYYELPQDPSLAFIWAADSNDVRSEGMSYGMMLAVQQDLHQQFDRLWKFTKTYLQFPGDHEIGAWHYYFRWQGRVDATTDPNNWAVNYGASTVPAPDGDEYFTAALFLAHRRWGSDGDVNYLAEAKQIASGMLHNVTVEGDGGMRPARYPIIHPEQKMVTFVPQGNSNGFSDPSYHLPAFYELFAQDGAPEDSAAWREVAETSRAYLVRSAHATTGLHPDYASFDGTPNSGGNMQTHDQFRYDAWRVVMNMAVDYAWGSHDARMETQVEKYHRFFSSRLTDNNVEAALFAVDGSNPSGGGSTALTATLAAGALASRHVDRARFVGNLWNVDQQQGQYRYFQEGVYLLGLLNTAGRFRTSWP